MLKHFLKRAVAVLLVLCMATAPVLAVTFSDVSNHWSKTYAEDMASRGIILGYTDGTFLPDKSVTSLELLVMLSRMYNISPDMTDIIYADYQSYLTGLFGTNYSWAHKNLALCLASNILTKAELEQLYQSNSLGQSALKEDVSVYLIKTMGLSAEVNSLTTYTLPFNDVASITAAKRPYVYVLQLHGIVAGDTANNFAPRSGVSRGVVATMLSRAIDYMEKNNLGVQLTNYASYQSVSGTIQGVVVSGSTLTISLTNVFTGERTITASTSSKTYLDGVLSAYNSITTGKYAMVRLNGGTVSAISVYSAPKTVSGSVTSIDNGKMTITDSVSKVTYKLMLTGDSEVQIATALGNQTGNNSMINADNSYSEATCIFDSSYRVRALLLSGGSSYIDGVVKGVETAGTATQLLFADYTGVVTRYVIPSGTAVTVNGSAGSLSASQAGCFARLKIGNDDQALKGVAVDTATTVVQGSVKSVLLQSTPQTLYVGSLLDSSISSAGISTDAKIYYEGGAITASQLQIGAFVSAKVQNDKVTEIHTYSSTSQIEGTLATISYGTSIVLQLLDETGKAVEFTLNPSLLPAIKRNGQETTIDKLRGGDAITVHIQYNKIASIETSVGQASTVGTVSKITLELGGNVVTIAGDNGAETSYPLANDAQILQNDVTRSLYDVKIGNRVSLVISNGEIVTLSIESTSTAASDLSGKILFVNRVDSSILIEVTESNGTTKTVTVSALNASRNSRIMNADGTTLTLSSLAVNNLVTVIGSYNGTAFEAKIIIKR